MTLLFIDSYEHYTTTEIPDKGYSESLSSGHFQVASAVGRRGGKCLASDGLSIGVTLTKTVSPASDTIIVGFAMSRSQYDDEAVMTLRDGSSDLASMDITSAGEIKLLSGGQTVTTATSFFVPGSYSYYELKYTKGTGADGVAELLKDGISVLSISNSSETTQASAIRLTGVRSAEGSILWDDLYVLNGLGTTNNDYLGDVRVDCHYVDSDGAVTDFTPNIAAANSTLVDDELQPDGDTTYVDSGTISDRDLYVMDTASLLTTIHGIQQVAHVRKTDAGTVTVDLISEKPAGSGEKISQTEGASDDYNYHMGIQELDPDDNTSWDDSKVNATEFGFKINNITA